TGGIPTDVTVLDPKRAETFHARVSFLPDQEHFLYFRGGGPEYAGVYLGSINLKPDEQSLQRVVVSSLGADFVPAPDGKQGHVLFLRDGTLMAQPFDATKFQVNGEAVPLAETIGSNNSSNGFYSSSDNGVLAFRSGTGEVRHLTWYDRKGKAAGKVGEPAAYN